MLRLFLVLMAVSCSAFQINHVSLRSPNHAIQKSQITSLRCSSERPSSAISLRRDAFIKLMVGSTSAAMISTIWSSLPRSVLAYSETKEELLSLANYIVKVYISSGEQSSNHEHANCSCFRLFQILMFHYKPLI